METKKLRSTVAALITAAALVCGSSQHAAAADAKPLVVVRDMDLNSLDPARAFCDTCQIYLGATYETLITVDADNKITPLLAKSWEANENQTHFVFHLAEQATFSDGTPVTADDVKWSFERLKNIKGAASFFMDGVRTVTAQDPHTLIVDMEAPNSEFLGMLAA